MNALCDQLLSQPVGIFGGGVSGQAVRKFIGILGGTATLFDETHGRGDQTRFLELDAKQHPLIINSPGFPPHHPWFAQARSAGCEVIGEIEFAAQFWNGPIFFVTGTNGKSTITQLLTAVLIEAGYDAFSFGNIGIPFSEHYRFHPRENAIAVVEISSFQAWNLRSVKVDGILWTNFAEDHLDWHCSMEQYFRAKWNALRSVEQGPVVLGKDVIEHAKSWNLDLPSFAEIVDADHFETNPSQPISAINQLNVCFVKAFVRGLGIDTALVDRVVQTFAFLPHRLECIGETEGIHFWNDSKATNFHAVEAALESFYQPIVWLGGGLDKRGDVEAFAQRIASKLRIAITFGQIGPRLADALLEAGVLTFAVKTMRDAVQVLRSECHPGDEVVLSPGFASFDQFTGYADRGRRFRQFVTETFFNPSLQPIELNHPTHQS